MAVGTELLLGQIVNTNAAYLGERLAELGLDTHYQVVVGDNHERMVDTIRMAVDRSDAVIITGGLGPTQDDITREALCVATGRNMLFSERHAQKLRSFWDRLGREFPESNLCQAQYPEGAEQLDNPRGTAPGLFLDHRGALIFALPGVPAELQQMLEDHVVPRLRRGTGDDRVLVSRVLRTWGLGESLVADRLDDLFRTAVNPSMAFLATAGEVKVRLTAKAGSAAEARAMIEPLERSVADRLGSSVFAYDDQTLEQIVLDELKERGWTIGTAESVTAGMLAARLSLLPGSSQVFRGGLVTYATDLKRSLLGIGRDVIDTYGVVSAETATAMADLAAGVLEADVVTALTGVAGPEPLDHPPGTIFVAIRTPGGTRCRSLRMPGDRERVRAYTTTTALQMTRLAIIDEWWTDKG